MKKKKNLKPEEKIAEGNNKLTRNAIIVFGICIFIILALLWKSSNVFLGMQDNVVQPSAPFPSSMETPTDTPIPTQMPQQTYQQPSANTIDCVGPDGKHLQVTQQECDNFNNAWENLRRLNHPYNKLYSNIPKELPNTLKIVQF